MSVDSTLGYASFMGNAADSEMLTTSLDYQFAGGFYYLFLAYLGTFPFSCHVYHPIPVFDD